MLPAWSEWEWWYGDWHGFVYEDPYWGTPYQVEERILFTYTGIYPDRWDYIVREFLSQGRPCERNSRTM